MFLALMVDLVLPGVALLLLGLGIMAFALLSNAKDRGAQVKGGGVVLVGPVPVVFGSDYKWASVAIVLAIALVLLVFLLNWV